MLKASIASGSAEAARVAVAPESHRPDFAPNSDLPRHGWYRFKEGFSASLVQAFIGEYMPKGQKGLLLDPFLGSGTTAVEGARLGLHVHGVEVNPFMAFLAKVKTGDYSNVANFESAAMKCLDGRARDRRYRIDDVSTLVERRGLKKWLFNKKVAYRFEQLRTSISKIRLAGTRELLLLALVSSIESVANARKDGKCWRYKSKWKELGYDGQALDDAFAAQCMRYAKDIDSLPRLAGTATVYQGDSRRVVTDTLYDGILTSPPYLNSFDYTDIYRPEMLLLKHARNSGDLRRLRFQTLRSHVQVAWDASPPLQIPVLRRVIATIEGSPLWCGRIPEMVNAYFVDLNSVIRRCAQQVRVGASVGIVVADSAYCGVVIPVTHILGEILQRNGFHIREQMTLRKTLGNGNHQQRSTQPLGEVLTVATLVGRPALGVARRWVAMTAMRP